jgi:hypothetical protein
MVKYMDKENVQGSITSDNQTSSYTMPWCIPLFATITASRNRSGLNKLFQLLRKVIVGVIIIPSVLHSTHDGGKHIDVFIVKNRKTE